ncbi:MAG: NosD domain-containing protein [Capsulimonadales bacterium]|nr:NosD domain-containing protein [Capsulimonadales bacterium]
MKNVLSFAVLSLTVASTTLLARNASAQALTISTPGVYVLNRNITVSSGDAIVINASNVVLDLGGRSVMTTSPATGRGIVVNAAKGVIVRNGTVGPFNMNVVVSNSENVTIDHLKVTGNNLAPAGGPVEMGIVFLDTRGSQITNNQITSVNLGVFIRGGGSVGNRTANNHIVGGPVNGNNILAMCWNPLPGGDGTDATQVPKGELVYNNHISGFTDGISFVTGSRGNVIKENVIQFFGTAFRPDTLTPGNNTLVDNVSTALTP